LLIFLLDITVLLLLARCLGWLAERVKLPAIVGELLTGMILGPSLLGNIAPGFTDWLLPKQAAQMNLVDAVSQLGVLLLVGITGTNLDVALLRRRSSTALWVSLSGLLVPLTLGVALGAALPASLRSTEEADGSVFAVFLGVAMCVSAVPVIAKTLFDLQLLHRNVGQLTLAAGMVDDAVGWFLLSIVSAAATTGVSAGRVSLSVTYLVAFVVLAAVVGRPVVRNVMRLAARSPDSGPTVATAVIVVLLGAVTTHSLGLEPIFGAFVAGILIGAPRAADQVKLAPLRTVVLSVLAPIFLATAGLRMDLTALADPVVALAALAVLTTAIFGKFAGAYIGARLSKLTGWEALALGAGMNSRGVVEVVVALTGLRLGVLDTATYTIIVLVAIVTSLMAPPLLRLAMSRVSLSDEERLRKIDHDAWMGGGPGRLSPATAGPVTVHRDGEGHGQRHRPDVEPQASQVPSSEVRPSAIRDIQ
jgi:Kef-type K+ transport system membrane component KefB